MSELGILKRERLSLSLFLRDGQWWLPAIIWTGLILTVVWLDSNPNPLFVAGIWAILFVLNFTYWIFTTEGKRWSYSPAPARNYPLSWHKWLQFPGLPLILMTITLFFVGPNIASGRGHVILVGTNTREVTNSTTFHIPFIESNQWWVSETKITINPTARTKDGKLVVADLIVPVILDVRSESVVKLAKRLGNPDTYQRKLREAVERQFASAVSAYSLKELPSNLVLEDLVGTNIGLEDLSSYWTGAIVVENVHRYADSKQ